MLEALRASVSTLEPVSQPLTSCQLQKNAESRELSLRAFDTAARQASSGIKLGDRKQLSLALHYVPIST